MRKLTTSDTYFLAAENDRVVAHVSALVVLEPSKDGLTRTALREIIAARLHLVPPFRWRLMEIPLNLDHGYWIEDPDFDLDYHVREIALPKPGSQRQLTRQIARIFERPLDRARPLWEMYLIAGLEGGRVGLLTKIHHALVDGVSGAEILGTLFDLSPEVREVDAPAQEWRPETEPGLLGKLELGVEGIVKRRIRTVASTPRLLAGIDAAPIVGDLPGSGVVARVASRIAGQAPAPPAELLEETTAAVPRTSFNHKVTAHRRITFATFPLDDVKAVKNAAGATVNDVMVALCAGAIRRWLVKHRELPDAPLVAMIPVSVRTEEERGEYGNKTSGLTVQIPTDQSDPVERLQRAHDALVVAKKRHAALPATLMQDATEFIPGALFNTAVQFLWMLMAAPGTAPSMNVTITNVPGPQFPLYCAGGRVVALHPIAPIFDGLGLNIGVMSYDGTVYAGIVADRDQMPDIDAFGDWMIAELAELRAALLPA